MFVRAIFEHPLQSRTPSPRQGSLKALAAERGLKVAAWYVENESAPSWLA